jgi:RNA polymerase sigma factor (sigma-70 family)
MIIDAKTYLAPGILMNNSDTTCWTMIEAAAEESQPDRDLFAKNYLPVVRAYLIARWSSGTLRAMSDDAVQDVFVECFRSGGPLTGADRDGEGGFRPFFFGVVRIVARRFEARQEKRLRKQQSGIDLQVVASDESNHSQVFDRAWAKSMMRQAAQRQAEFAEQASQAAVRRVELLRLRFHEGMPIREIAKQWDVNASQLHHEYATARREFKNALIEVVTFHQPGSQAEVEQECSQLLAMLA